MKPLFTVHVGEYLVGSYIEQHYKRVSVWIPSRDTGVDLMVSDRRGRSTVTERDRCWEARSLEDDINDQRRIAAGVYDNSVRDFTKWLNEWGTLMKKLNR